MCTKNQPPRCFDAPQDMLDTGNLPWESKQGLVTVKLASLLPLLERKLKCESPSSPEHYVSSVSISAETADDCVNTQCTFKIQVLTNETITVPLLPFSVAVTSAEIIKDSNGTTALATNATSTSASVVCSKNQHALLAHGEGDYTVVVDALCPYSSKSKSGFDLSGLPKSSSTTLKFTVKQKADVQITVEPALKTEATASNDGGSSVTAILPPTGEASVRWTEASHEDITAEAAVQPVSATVEQQILYSVGEGMLLVDAVFNYDIRNGTMSVFDVQLDPRVRILTVEGQAVKRWDVIQNTAATTVDANDDNDASSLESVEMIKVLRVSLDHGIEGAHSLNLTAELDLQATTTTFTCPVFSHLNSAVTREKGFIGVEARTNVEVEQYQNCVNCVPVDVEEIPSDVSARTTNPLLLAYKYLMVPFELQLAVKKHGDVDVLIASIDSAHFCFTKTEEGMSMQKVVMAVRNTQKQYVRISLGPECEIWSTIVQGKAVKPARDQETNAVMIPLPKNSAHSSTNKTFYVELVWVDMSEDAMKDSGGDLDFSIPAVDIPMNKVYVSTYVPHGFRYGEFTGDLTETVSFTGVPPCVPQTVNNNAANNVITPPGRAQVQANAYTQQVQSNAYPQQVQSNNYSQGIQRGDDALGEARPMSSSFASTYRKRGGGMWGRSAGVVPVQVNLVTSGKSFLFERLVVINQGMSLSVSYRLSENPLRQKRKLDLSLWDRLIAKARKHRGKILNVAVVAVAVAAVSHWGLLGHFS